jgi:hypothetical protein
VRSVRDMPCYFRILSDFILPLMCFAASIWPPVTVRVAECPPIRPLRPDGFRSSLGCDRGKARQRSCASTTHLVQPPQLANSSFKVVSSTVSCHPVLTPWDGVSALSDVKHAINFESRLGLMLVHQFARGESYPQ